MEKSANGDTSDNNFTENSTSNKDDSQNTPSSNVSTTQISRLEAKLDDVKEVVLKIQRMVISLTTNTGSVRSNNSMTQMSLEKLPFTTDELLVQFEADLSDTAYRQEFVSVDFFY